MDREDFFEKIRSKCSSEREFIIEIIKARGFLIDEISDEWIVSDNSHKDDAEYLDKLLRINKIGHVASDKIVIENTDCSEFIRNEFCDKYHYRSGWGECRPTSEWKYFKRREHGIKVPVFALDPFIARYIKAISACCVITSMSCDGDHAGRSTMIVNIDGQWSLLWHKLICEKMLVNKYKIKWSDGFHIIKFNRNTKYETYYAVNKAAELLYRHRKEIRHIKQTALADMSPKYLEQHPSDEIAREFAARASELFDRAIANLCLPQNYRESMTRKNMRKDRC